MTSEANADICYMTATELAAAVRAKRLSPVEIVDAFLARIAQFNPTFNAYCLVADELARDTAKQAEAAVMRDDTLGTLHGVPISIKDVIYTKGLRTTRGSALHKDYVPTEDSPVVERVKQAGAIILGKTNTPEYGWRGSTDSPLLGECRNPWDTTKTPGGSSGGASAALAAGLCPLAIGTDGAGSIRIPASYTGVVGLKPHYGRVPAFPPSGAAPVAHLGPMARNVTDTALLLSVIAGPDERDYLSLPAADNATYLAACAAPDLGGLRIAWSADLGLGATVAVDPEVARLTENAARRFADWGAIVEDAPQLDLAATNFELAEEIGFYAGISAALAPIITAGHGDVLDPGLKASAERFQRERSILDAGRATTARIALWAALLPLFTRYDLLLCPTMPGPAFALGLVGYETQPHRQKHELDWTPFTYIFNLTQQPALSINCGFTAAGLPVGLQIVGRRFAETTVLRAAAVFERHTPDATRIPVLAV